ncbi:hypothetical protein MANES_14G075050v8 [Manihot esculenta]|uniref:Uncharacterized protein n=1 Tax=Manihot esculenta TaxID=3983 RepID=A0ACB7GF65_MANES|nr:hypothetical protein MANES_14G075050v8 [Manihot esculenta]
MDSLSFTSKFSRNHSGREFSIWPPRYSHSLTTKSSNSSSLHLPHVRDVNTLWRWHRWFWSRWFRVYLHHRRWGFFDNDNRRQLRSIRKTMRMRNLRMCRNLKSSAFFNNNNRRRLGRVLWWRCILVCGRRRLLVLDDQFIIVTNFQPNLAFNPAKNTLLFERKINKPLFTSLGKLRTIQLYPSQKVVFAAAAIAVLLIIEDLDFQLLKVHIIRVRDNELKRLIPFWIEVPILGGGSLPLAIEVSDDIGTGAALAILGKKITSIDNFDKQLANGSGRLRRRRHGLIFYAITVKFN